MRKTKKLCAWLLACMMAVSLLPGTALAAEMESGESDIEGLTVNSSKVAFAGHEWWVIGDEESGVYPQEGHITLLSANSDFGTTAFRTGSMEGFDNSTQYATDWYYYANNPTGMDNWTTPNEYAGSTLQQKMEEIAETFSEKELAVITARDLASDATETNNWSYGENDYIDGIAGQGISGQKLWAISAAEWNTIDSSTVRDYGSYSWWLRSPHSTIAYNVQLGYRNGDYTTDLNASYDYYAVRPALSLNLESVIFTSAASEESGKSVVAVEDGLTAMEGVSASSTVKFTMQDSSQTLTVSATEEQSTQTGQTLSFTYSNATTGTNQYVSCVLIDESGAVAYYAKLVDCSDSSAASGELSISLEGVDDGTYTLQIFSEEANDYLYTDFCSEPVTMTVEVDGGSGTVSEFDGHVHSYDQQLVSDTYKASDATCTEPASYYYYYYYCDYYCVCGNAGTSTFTYGTALGHDWGEPSWSWEDDYSSAIATFICQRDSSHIEIVDADISSATTKASSTEAEQTLYTATVEWNESIYTDTQALTSTTGTTTDGTVLPQTGDNSTIAFWIAAMLAAGVGLIGTVLYSRKEKYSR